MSLTLTLGARDLERTAKFYGEILELEIETFVPGAGQAPVLLLYPGDAVIVFRRLDAMEALHPALFQNLERHPLGVGSAMEFSVAALQPIRVNIDRAGLPLLYELDDEEFDRREIWLHDPDGYLVVLCEQS